MDTLTHALLGATVACAAAPRRPRLPARQRLLLGGAAAALPDADFAGFLVNPLTFLADWHQAATHSLVLLPLWALLIGAVFAWLVQRRSVFAEASFVSALALASHIASDVITVYGTALLHPLSALRVSLGTSFVIDPVFTAIVVFGLAAGVWTGRRAPAGIGLALLCLYVAGQAVLQQRALETGRASARAQGLPIERLSALPQPFSPFNWKLIAAAGDLYHVAHVNLAGHGPWVPALPGLHRLRAIADAYLAPAQLTWQTRHRWGEQPALRALAEQLWHEPRLAPFRRFAAYPGVSRLDTDGTDTCVWFTDLRYDLPASRDTFRYGFCRHAVEAPWQLYRLRYFSERSRQRLSP